MSTNAMFREDELVSRRVKVGNDWQTRTFPVVGGRLRLSHETNEHLSIQTELVKLEGDFIVVKATVQTDKGTFTGTGTASAQRDSRLADSLVELAETRAIARSLRFGGIGVEYCGAEEVNHLQDGGLEERTTSRSSEKEAGEPHGDSKPQAKQPEKPKSNGNGVATQAQCRALYALTKRAGYAREDIDRLLSPLDATTFQELTKEDASQLIGYLQTEVAA